MPTKNTSKNTAYLISAAGTNFGDDLIALLWIKNLKAAQPKLRIVVDCVDPSTFALALSKLHLDNGVCAINLFWRACGHYPAELNDAVPLLERDLLFNESTDFRTARTFFADVAFAHFLGGGYVNDNWPRNALLAVIFDFFKQQYNFPVFWTGASVVPSSLASKLRFAKHLPVFDTLTTRDTKSHELLASWNAATTCTCDDAFLSFFDIVPKKSNRKILFLNVQRDCRSAEFYLKNVHEVMRVARQWDGEIVYLSCFPLHDAEAAQYIGANTQSKKNITVISEHDFLEKLFNGDFDIGENSHALVSRFHLHLLLAMFGVSGQFIAPDDTYYTNKHNSLVEQGSQWKRFTGALEKTPKPPLVFGAKYATQKQTELEKILTTLDKRIENKNTKQKSNATEPPLRQRVAQLLEHAEKQEQIARAEQAEKERLSSEANELRQRVAQLLEYAGKQEQIARAEQAETERLSSEANELRQNLATAHETLKLTLAEKNATTAKLASTVTALDKANSALENAARLAALADQEHQELCTRAATAATERDDARMKIAQQERVNATLTQELFNAKHETADAHNIAFAALEMSRNQLLLRLTTAEQLVKNYHKMSKDFFISSYRKLRRTLGIWEY